MIRASQLEQAAGQLDGFAGRLATAAESFAAIQQQAMEHASSLAGGWGGPLPSVVDTAAANYISQIDGGPISDAAPVVRRWAAAARELAASARTLEQRRAHTVNELVHTTPASIGTGPEADALAAAQRQSLSADISSIDRQLDQLHQDWTRTCSSYAGIVDGYTAAIRVQAAASALTEFAAASPGSFEWFDPTAMAGWLATLTKEQLAALFADEDIAEGWWASLSEDQRIAFVASQLDGIDGVIGEVVEEWKGELDSDGLRALYTAVAMAKAGIDPALWDPTKGFAANEETVHAVYDYYASLYLSDPDKFWWAGMASMIGPSFVAGMADLSDTGAMLDVIERLAEAGGHLPGIPGSIGDVADLSAEELAEELKFYEVTLLLMQKEIFLDMAVAHEAYLDGGMDAIERLYADDPYFRGAEAVAAWQRIDEGAATGNTELVAEGNRDLLFREQRNVIDDDYRAMSARPVTGEVFTYVFTAVGAPSIPGAESFSEVFPINAEVRGGTDDGFFGPIRDALLPVEAEVAVGTATPLPDGNVADFDDRWALIEQDTLPAYVDLVENHPEQAAEILSTPVADRVEEWRIVHRIDDIATNWEPYVDVDVRPDGSVFSVIGDGASALWDWANGGDDAGPAAPVEVPTGTTTTTTPTPTTVPPPSVDPAPQPSPEPGPPTGTIPGG